ncbi:MAG: restriction endonuclease subunit S [Deltaproteobacteria bacterium]|jgi:type I restriction enzyme, S subunit|nr:restriction endonuclease subunit S [Deltaproteobacteria bacterium]MBT4642121.1 restriction endonuclease subunit S [Deltaproteobacteria bacterium]MBT6767341.1 restriction endonuclease subunit S [Prolixibacteraceae bacterium]MBT7711930.1 restriction endonuclease subunit S [Deltaproteobacteria bacterium]
MNYKESKKYFKRLGDYIQLVDSRNKELSITNLLGINISKNFMPSIANTSNIDLSRYKIISKDQFATNIMHVGRDERLPVALYGFVEPAIISPAYMTFEVIDQNELLPEYLMITFQRSEFDRLSWYYCDSSIRGGLEWERLCEMKIPIPDIEEQQKQVMLYNALLFNQKSYENSLADLQLICDTFIENLIKTEKPKVLGEFIEQSDERNKDLQVTLLQGVSTAKVLIETKANTTGVNFKTYKVVRTGEFVYVADTSRRGDKIALAMNSAEPCIVSGIYTVFRVNKPKELLSEYLYLWFARPEFDRYARFHSWGSARETFDWTDMCDVKLPIPDIKVQEAIITIYNTLETRKQINEKLKNTIKPLCPVLIKGVVDCIHKLAIIKN